jgi:hypothetical protein
MYFIFSRALVLPVVLLGYLNIALFHVFYIFKSFSIASCSSWLSEHRPFPCILYFQEL